MRSGRFVVPIKAEFGGEFPGIVHDSSASGQTLFIEPLATVEINNRFRALRAQEEHEVARILAELSKLIGDQAEQVEANVEVFAQVDLVLAKVRLGGTMRASSPELVDDATLAIDAGRHPLLGERAIPQSFRLDEEARVIVISGPNMGGKTVALKLVGLLLCMAYCGLPLPAESTSVVGRFTRLFTDIGDEQSIAQNASTFSAHLRRLSEIVDAADAFSLILIDEIGTGTEPSAGAALAVAVLERFLAVRARAIVTTHSTELKLFAHDASGAVNASVRFDPQTYAPTYAIDVGTPGQSLAFALARAMHLDARIVDRAEELLSAAERNYDRALADLAQLHQEAEVEKTAAMRERGELQRALSQARQRVKELEGERRTFATAAEEKLTARLREFVRELESRSGSARGGRVTRGQSELLSKTLAEMRRELGVEQEAEAATGPVAIALGDKVRVGSLGQEGTVVEDFGDAAAVGVGAMRIIVSKSELTRIGEPRRAPVAAGGVRTDLDAVRTAQSELDVRGKRYIEAEPLVDAWIDRALLAGYSPLRLIHGKGTGMLGRGLQEFLRAHAGVKSVRYGNADEGAGGVTIVELR
jgi:DNA mismatch repair protein MutS2